MSIDGIKRRTQAKRSAKIFNSINNKDLRKKKSSIMKNYIVFAFLLVVPFVEARVKFEYQKNHLKSFLSNTTEKIYGEKLRASSENFTSLFNSIDANNKKLIGESQPDKRNKTIECVTNYNELVNTTRMNVLNQTSCRDDYLEEFNVSSKAAYEFCALHKGDIDKYEVCVLQLLAHWGFGKTVNESTAVISLIKCLNGALEVSIETMNDLSSEIEDCIKYG